MDPAAAACSQPEMRPLAPMLEEYSRLKQAAASSQASMAVIDYPEPECLEAPSGRLGSLKLHRPVPESAVHSRLGYSVS